MTTKNFPIDQRAQLLNRLQLTNTLLEKLDILNQEPTVVRFLAKKTPINTFLQGLTPECDFAIKSILAIGQGDVVFRMEEVANFEKLRELLQQLLQVERAYSALGGIVGYHVMVLRLLEENASADEKVYDRPGGLDISTMTGETWEAVRWGIDLLPEMGELYPVGGAGDRLNLHDPVTGEALPCAKLPFCGRSLLETMLRDLQGREVLYERITGKKVITPVAFMTSQEKNNDGYVREILEELNWLGRPKDSFFFFVQPNVPVITNEGNWSLSAPLTLYTKPGGHGVMWKLAQEAGLFEWFAERGRKKVLVRQVNNPMAGTDQGLLAFTGIGAHHDKAFGFASCERLIGAPEGMNIVVKRENRTCLTNIEYTDFAKNGIEEAPKEPGSPYSAYPANTNILFGDLKIIEELATTRPIPGLIINMKNRVPYTDEDGATRRVKGGRLESTMQNLADYLEAPATFLTYNERRKTISVTKQSYTDGSIANTPNGAFMDLLANNRELLRICGVTLPNEGLLFLFHPALGPLYSVIAQKIQGGSFAAGSELQLDVAEAAIENMTLEGSMRVLASDPLEASVVLRGVTVRNSGIGDQISHEMWSNDFQRKEELKIELGVGSQFLAEGVTIEGARTFRVPDGKALHVTESGEELIPANSDRLWNYKWNDEGALALFSPLP